MAPTLHTARLLLTPVGEHDVARLHAHWNNPQVARWLWDANPVPLQTVATLVARSTRAFQHAGWGLWALRPATDAPLIGACGLSPFEPAPGIELLYSLAPTHWSRGLATEAATAVLAYAFDTLTLPEVLATTDDDNHHPSLASSPASVPPQPPEPRSAPHLPLLPHPTTQVCSFQAPVAQWIEQRTSNP
jgi:[ribosomal protein S5]-alanine N-acetyltransferase